MSAMFVFCIDFTNQLESTRKRFTSFGIGAVVILTSVQNDICLNLFHSIFDNGNDKKVVVYIYAIANPTTCYSTRTYVARNSCPES